MADTYLSRTPSSAGNQQIWTLSAWIKKSKTGTANQNLFSQTGGGSASQRMYVLFSDDLLVVSQYNGSSSDFNYTTNAVFRDPSAWYHLVVSVDTTQATASNRVKIYMNGEQITSFSSTTNPSQNLNTYVNTTQVIGIGHDTKVASRFFDGYMAEMHLTDGIAYTPTTFGETDTSGIWVPKVGPSVTYGTNGFYLKFENSGAMGTDSSGNSNTFSVGGGTVRQVDDTPTNNFATINSINASSIITISEGNLRTTAVGAWYSALGTIYATSGKWYFEAVLTVDNWVMVGVAPTSQDINLSPGGGVGTKSMALVFSTDSSRGDISYNGGNSVYTDGGHGINTGDIISVALDLDNNNVKFYKNNTQLYNLSNLLSDEPYTFGVSHYNGSALVSNFGQNGTFNGAKTAQGNADGNGKGDFYYAPPTGFLALCTDNLSSTLTIPINKGADNFNPILYTGTGTTQSITGVGFRPDLVWLKARTQSYYHNWYDIIRGGTKAIFSNATVPEATDTGNLQTFDSDGFTADGFAGTNGSGVNYVAWNWLASNTTASNTDGTITSTVSVNQTSGFSVVTYTGNRTAGATVGHGLGVAPSMVIAKCRTADAGWPVFHTSLGGSNFVRLNQTSASASNSVMWNNTTPSSTVVTLGGGDETNNNTGGSVMYCFAEIEGYSKFGSYTGNASTDGPFIYTGFKPSWVMIKRIDGANGWTIYDSVRNPSNVVEKQLMANSSGAEEADAAHNAARDYLSNGFKIRETGNDVNVNGSSYLYMAFAENPFVTSTGKPVTAR